MLKLPKKQTKEEKQKQTAQRAIPLKAVHGGLLITPDNKLVKILRISSRNMELMSNFEMNRIFDKYEDFLTGLEFPIQETVVSQPVDLTRYIEHQRQILKNTTNPIKRQLLQTYMDYTDGFTKSQQMIQRQRYIIFSEKISDTTEEAYIEAVKELNERASYIRSGLHDLELSAEDLTNKEIIKYFHTFFDYYSAQQFPIQNEIIPQMITGGKE